MHQQGIVISKTRPSSTLPLGQQPDPWRGLILDESTPEDAVKILGTPVKDQANQQLSVYGNVRRWISKRQKEKFFRTLEYKFGKDVGVQKAVLYFDGGRLVRMMLDINTASFDHIVVLSNRDIDVQESDAKTLISLLHLRSISEAAGVDYSIVTEMLDMRNRELGLVAKADDFVVSDNLISLMLSQLSENRELKKVYDVLFQSEGSEIYLKPVTRYAKTGVPMDFYTIAASAAELHESAIGYRITSEAQNPDQTYGVHLNPNKLEKVIFSNDDLIIVLSED